jgi:Peptidase C26.
MVKSRKKKTLKNKKYTRKRGFRKNKTHKKKKKTFVIGIVSVPLSPNKKYFKVCGDSYIASSHLSWMKRQGIIPLVIPYDTKDLKYYFKRIHGLYLPSGGAFAGTQQKYYNCCKKLMLMAMKENDKGCHFPVWGCCMGFQQMLILPDGNDDVKPFPSKIGLLKIIFF